MNLDQVIRACMIRMRNVAGALIMGVLGSLGQVIFEVGSCLGFRVEGFGFRV